MEVGDGPLGVAAVADPSDQFASLDPVSYRKPGPHALAPAVVGAIEVVVEVDVVRGPPVVVADPDRGPREVAAVLDLLDEPGRTATTGLILAAMRSFPAWSLAPPSRAAPNGDTLADSPTMG